MIQPRDKSTHATALYMESLKEAGAMADFLIANPTLLATQGRLYGACMAGLIVCYARPFVGNDGFQDSSFLGLAKFSSEEKILKEAHEILVTGRNKIVAHAHLDHEHSNIGKSYDFHHVAGPDDEEFGYNLNLPTLNPEVLPIVRRLIERQLATIEDKLEVQSVSKLKFLSQNAPPPAASSPAPENTGD